MRSLHVCGCEPSVEVCVCVCTADARVLRVCAQYCLRELLVCG